MLLAIVAIMIGLALLVWSADYFVEGASVVAYKLGMPPLLIGMLIIGLGTSAPELIVSTIAALQQNSGLAIGNAFGSNITNIALIMGITALITPIIVPISLVKKELPILIAITALTAFLLSDAHLSRLDAILLLIAFIAFVIWSIYDSRKNPADVGEDIPTQTPFNRAVFATIAGLILLIIASRLVVWGAVSIAGSLGIDDLIIGLTVVAIGTSLPELASTIAAVRKNQHDLAFGNIIGSNIFNTLAVVGIAGVIHPIRLSGEVFSRDILVMSFLTLLLLFMSFKFYKRRAHINRYEGAVLLALFIAYNAYLIYGATQSAQL